MILDNNRLITFGCSHTFGVALSDTSDTWDENIKEFKQDPNNRTPSKFAWPEILGKLINRITINKANFSASNNLICFKALNYNWQENDIGVFLWTHNERRTFFKSEQSTKELIDNDFYLPGNFKSSDLENWYDFANIYEEVDSVYSKSLSSFSKEYLKKYYFKYDTLIQLYQQINLIKFYLDNKSIINYHLLFCDSLVTKFNWNTVNFINVFFEDYAKFGFGSDNMHNGNLAHKKFAQDVFKEMVKNDK